MTTREAVIIFAITEAAALAAVVAAVLLRRA
jgi:hypothetical protein